MTTIAQLIDRHDGRIAPSATLAEAARLMLGEKISSVIVVDGDQAVGIVTETDMLHAMREHRALRLPVSAIMTSPVHTVPATTDFREAYRMAARLGIRHIVVADAAGLPVGVASESEFRQYLGADFYRQLNTVDLLMERLFPRLPPDASVDNALAAMESAHASCIVVVDGHKPVGILTERDVVRLFVEASGEQTVAAVMTSPAITIGDHASLAAAAALMSERQIRHIVVTDERGHAVGLLSEHTLMRPLELDLVDETLVEHRNTLRQADEALLLRNAALAGQIRGEALAGVLELIVLSVEAEAPGWRCSIMLADPAGRCLRVGAAPRLADSYLAAIDGLPIAEGAGACGTAAYRRQTFLIEDVCGDAQWAPYHDLARSANIGACWSAPIVSPDGELLGTFAAYQQAAGGPGDSQRKLLEQACQLAALVLGHERNRQYLQENRETLRSIFDSVGEALIVQDVNGRFLDANRMAEEMSGQPRVRLLGAHFSQFGAPGLNDDAAVGARIPLALAGTPQTFEYWAEAADGHLFPCEVRLRQTVYHGSPAVIASITDITQRNLQQMQFENEGRLARALAVDPTPERIFRCIVDCALRHPEFDACGLYLREPDGSLHLVAHAGLSEDFVDSVQHYAADTPQALLVAAGGAACSCHDPAGHCLSADQIRHPLLDAEGLYSLAVVPILLDQQVIACLNLASRRNRRVAPTTLPALETLAGQFAQTLLAARVQRENRQLQQNLSGLFETLSESIVVVGANGRILHVNPGSAAMLGQPQLALPGEAFATLFPATEEARVDEALRHLLRGEAAELPGMMRHATGHLLPVESRVSTGTWNGESALFCIARDVSERFAALARQKLAASVFEHAHEGIMVTDAGGRIVEVNPTFTELTGYTRDEAIGRNADLLNSGHHDADFYREMWQAIREIGYWRGEVWNRKKCGEIFVELLTISTVRDHAGDVTHFVGIFSDITLLKQHQQRLEHLAHFDALTQLPNRMLLADRMQLAMAQSERKQKILAVCYLDLDGFKPVNDQFGHATGDRLLIEVAQRLKACVRGGDTVARLGGDEFVLLFAEQNDLHECDHAISRVLAMLAQPFQIAGHCLHITASIGATLYPNDGSDADTLLRHADQAMYVAKQAGRNRFHLFDPETDRRARARRDEVRRIREGLANEEFVLYYQPKIDMRQGQVIGAEALIRWQHPERGLLLPGEFLPVIEGSELAIELGDWVIRTALHQLATWQAAGKTITLSINIAGEHLQHPGFVQRLAELLAEHPGLQAQQLELEILETAALEDLAQVSELFAACRRLGIRFALDDFGTGYSSLTYFRRLPADMLKIDQSFVRGMLDDPDDLAIVEGVIALTRTFAREVIAEGVETVEHGLALLLLGCDQAQGFGIARPMPAAELPGWIADFRPDPLWSSATGFSWSRDDLPMLIAEVDHGRWIKQLTEHVAGGNGPPPARDCHECGFGRWYYGTHGRRYAGVEAYVAIETVHEELHEIAGRMLNHCELGQQAAAQALMPALEAASARLTDCLQMIQAEILMTAQTSKR